MAKQALIILAVVLVFGVLVPYYKGLEFLDPLVIVVYACMSLLFVVPASAEIFAVQPASPAEVISRLGTILAYGWGSSVLMLAAGIVTVNVTNWHGRMLVPKASLLLSALLLGLAASVAVIAGTALLARRVGSRSAKAFLRIGFLALLLTAAFGFRYFPVDWRTAINRHMTTTGLMHFSLWACAAFTLAAAILVPRLLRGAKDQ